MSYLRPHRLEDALDWLAAESPLVMAGCTDIYPLHQTPSLDGPLLDITGLDELRGITAVEGWRRFGAATSWTDILRADLPAAYDGLKAAARELVECRFRRAAQLVAISVPLLRRATASPV